MPRPLLVGLTGSFGAGKSTVARFFREEGVRVLSADRLAHEVFLKSNRLYPRVHSLFPGIKGSLTRSKIAPLVFQDSKKRRSLERLIHPYVRKRIREELGRTQRPVVILEVPLLFESGFDRDCDLNIVVKARTQEVIKRLFRKGFRKDEIRARWRAQMPLGEKIRRADYLIDNSKGLDQTRRQVVRIWKELQK